MDAAAALAGFDLLPPELQIAVGRLVPDTPSNLRLLFPLDSRLPILNVDLASHDYLHLTCSLPADLAFFQLLTALRLVDHVVFTLPSNTNCTDCSDDFLPFLLACVASSTPFRVARGAAGSPPWGPVNWPGCSIAGLTADLTKEMEHCTEDCRDGWTCGAHLDTIAAAVN